MLWLGSSASLFWKTVPSWSYGNGPPASIRSSVSCAWDGTVFQNREALLPSQSTGYNHEYTVITPGSSDRGARRIVTGEETEEDYYTADHYESFDLVDHGC